MKIQRLALAVGQRHQPRFDLFHIARYVGELLIGFTDVNIVLCPSAELVIPRWYSAVSTVTTLFCSRFTCVSTFLMAASVCHCQ